MTLRAIWALPAIAIMTVVMSLLAMVSTIFSPSGQAQHRCARFWGRFILWVCGVRLSARGLEHIPAQGPFILMSNHQSNMDIPILLTALPVQFRFLAKESLFRIPFLGWYLRRCRHIPIHRKEPRKAVRSLREAAEKIRGGVPVLVFPEGTRSSDGELQEFKKGGFLLATFAGVPIIPLAIEGSCRILPRGSAALRGGRVNLVAEVAVETVGATSKDTDKIAEAVREGIRQAQAAAREVERAS